MKTFQESMAPTKHLFCLTAVSSMSSLRKQKDSCNQVYKDTNLQQFDKDKITLQHHKSKTNKKDNTSTNTDGNIQKTILLNIT